MLFDTGNGAARRPAADNLLQMLQGAGTIGNARYVTGSTEYDYWSSDDRLSGPTENNARLVRANVVPLAEKTSFIGDQGKVVPGITGLDAFGHTPGHMAFLIESGGETLLLWGDTANHYAISVQRPDWHVSFDTDKEAAAATRKRLFDQAAADRIPVTGYHMPSPPWATSRGRAAAFMHGSGGSCHQGRAKGEQPCYAKR